MVGFLQKPTVHGSILLLILDKNRCLHSGLLQKPQAPMSNSPPQTYLNQSQIIFIIIYNLCLSASEIEANRRYKGCSLDSDTDSQSIVLYLGWGSLGGINQSPTPITQHKTYQHQPKNTCKPIYMWDSQSV